MYIYIYIYMLYMHTRQIPLHYNNVTRASWRFTSPAVRLFVQLHRQHQIWHHCTLREDITWGLSSQRALMNAESVTMSWRYRVHMESTFQALKCEKFHFRFLGQHHHKCRQRSDAGTTHRQTLTHYSPWPSHAMWHHKSGSTLAHVIACCLKATSHYLDQ